MEFSISELVVPDWRGAASPARPMSDQVWEVLESFSSKDQIGNFMQGLKLVDQSTQPDATLDAREWDLAAAAMRQVLGDPDPAARAAVPGAAIYSAFELVLAQAKARGAP